MKKIPKFLSLIVGGVMFITQATQAQQSKVTAEKPAFDELLSPDINAGGKNKSFKPKSWLEVEAKIKVEESPEPKSGVIGEVLVKWYVAVKNPEKPGTFWLLSKSITHTNVPANEEIYSSVYISPASLKRLSGGDNGGKNSVEMVGYEVLVNGEVKARESNKPVNPAKPWWNTSNEKVSQSDEIPLLTKPQTPFAVLWWDRYAEVKMEK